MTELLKAYTALSASSSKSNVSNVLQSIINAPLADIVPSDRIALINAILRDLKAASGGSKGTLTARDAAQALLALKTLGKNHSGSLSLSSPENLSTLLSLASAFKNDMEASNEALRCIANALLLIEPARTTFLEKEVDGGRVCLTSLHKSNTPDQIFIFSRILFLATASGPPFLQDLVDEKHHGHIVSDIVGEKLDILAVGIQSGTKMAKEAMTDLLKFAFNILLHYPKLVPSEPQSSDVGLDGKVMGDFWNAKLDGFLAPLLKTFALLPPTFPNPIAAPLTHVIHALITIPVSSSLRSIWLASNGSQSSASPKQSPTTQTPPDAASGSAGGSGTQTPFEGQSSNLPKPSTLDRALSVIAAGRRSLSRSPSPRVLPPVDVLQRAYDLLDVSFSHFFPENIEPDEQEVRDRCKQESPDNTLDDLLSPLLVLITKLCNADQASRRRLRQWLVPDDLDRSTSLEGRSDLLGRCLRLLSSVYHTRLKDSVGEMLFAMSDSNASTLSALVGYGNIAGFLFHKGIMNAPPAPAAGTSDASLTTTSGANINPITGTIESRPQIPDMTDEEKEKEMEKLFVLFDRLEKTGAVPPEQNPVRKAIQQAAFGGSQ